MLNSAEISAKNIDFQNLVGDEPESPFCKNETKDTDASPCTSGSQHKFKIETYNPLKKFYEQQYQLFQQNLQLQLKAKQQQ